VAARLGYCGLDRRRAALSGDELRGCWQRPPGDSRPAESAPWASRVIDPASGGRRSRVDFVPVGEVEPPASRLDGFRHRLWEDVDG
jgi:hypothetical protein